MVYDKNMKRFIKENLDLLTTKSTNQIKEIKSKKNQFWRKLSITTIPRNQEIAFSTVQYLIKNKMLITQNDLDTLLETSDYISKFLTIKDVDSILTEIYTEKEDLTTSSFLDKKDYTEIKSREYHQQELKGPENEIPLCESKISWDEKTELLRRYGYDILINKFEPLLRDILINEVLIINYGLQNWINQIPLGVIQILKEEKDFDINNITIEEFFDETYIWCLKEISLFSGNYKFLNSLTGALSQEKYNNAMDELNEIRKKIAHAKSSFSGIDLSNLIFNINFICHGDKGKEIIDYIERESYKYAQEIPISFYEEYECPNNLPNEDYDLVGGFVGRKEEIKKVKQLLFSNQDRIISITGAGGIGKTAIALKICYNILADKDNPYEAVLWFSAKESKLTEYGIVSTQSDIKNCEQLSKDILIIVDPKAFQVFKEANLDYGKYKEHIYKILSSRKCLIIIDNLETIKDEDTIEFIKDVPRPSQVLITSRRGLAELERRYELPDFNEKDAIKLFRVISKERNRKDLLKLNESNVLGLVKRVKCYPLLIKWSIGRVCIGKEINEAFSEIYSGKSEIAQFSFNDVFIDLKNDSKLCLYSMIIYGDKPITKHFLKHLTNLDDNSFEDVIRELIIVSFVYSENVNNERGLITTYQMLSLTRGFVQYQLDQNQKEYAIIQSRYFELSMQIEEYEKSKTAYHQSLISLGIKSDDDKISFNYVKTAKAFEKVEDFENAKKNYEEANRISPNFPYSINEYAKFEIKHGHYHESEQLFKKSMEIDPENWHTFYHYGRSLKTQNKISESIIALEKAKELNPDFIIIYNELGRVYTFNGEYEKAEKMFNEINTREKYPNIRRKILTTKYQSDNYKRWSESFFKRMDFQGGLDKLFKALEIIEKEKYNIQTDLSVLRLEKKICLDIAINLSKNNNFDEALSYFKRAHKKLILPNGIIVANDEDRSIAYYYEAKYGYELKKLNLENINKYIKKGLALSRNDDDFKRLSNLAFRVNKQPDIPSSEKKFGQIKFFDFQKGFGIIESDENSYIFFKSGFFNYIDDKTLIESKGKEVTFILIDNKEKPGRKLATFIQFEL